MHVCQKNIIINLSSSNMQFQNTHIRKHFGIDEIMIKLFTFIYHNFPIGKITKLKERGLYFDGEESLIFLRNHVEKNDWSNIEYTSEIFMGIDNHIIPFRQKIYLKLNTDQFYIDFYNNGKNYNVELESRNYDAEKQYFKVIELKNYLENEIASINSKISTCQSSEKIKSLHYEIEIIRRRLQECNIILHSLSEPYGQIKNWNELRVILLNCEIFNAIVDPPIINNKIYSTFIHTLSIKFDGISMLFPRI